VKKRDLNKSEMKKVKNIMNQLGLLILAMEQKNKNAYYIAISLEDQIDTISKEKFFKDIKKQLNLDDFNIFLKKK
jgi:uncharacterized 2Fe-2S/4Fe-4S cluster protein (DUF4445 family)